MSRTIRTPRQEALRRLLVAERQKARLSQQQLANKLKRQQSLIARLESGQRRIDVVEFLELAEAIGFDPGRAIMKIKAHKR